jgi:hypothetical protein
MSKSRELPRPSERPIEMVLREFLAEQATRLSPATSRQYENVIYLFTSCLNGYGSSSLDKDEEKLFQSLYRASGKGHREFSQIFGPDKISMNVDEFLNYFMVRKVLCGNGMLRAAGTVMKKLGKWLQAKGYVATDDAARIFDRGRVANKELPATAALSQMLDAYVGDEVVGEVQQTVEDHFTIKAVRPGYLQLASLIAEGGPFEVPVPGSISDAAQEGWTISGMLGKTSKGWRFVETWNVYP